MLNEQGAGREEKSLDHVGLFRLVSAESMEGIVSTCRSVTLQRGETLLVPGEKNESLYIVISGRLRVHLETVASDPVAFIDPGDVVGELSIIDGRETSAFVIAGEETHLMVMAQDALWSLVTVSHAAACNLLTILSTRLRNANSIIVRTMLQERSYHHFGSVDALTGLHNRHWLDGILPRLLSRSSYTEAPVSVLMIDVDFFKNFNDAHGHLCGDRAIHTVAQLMTENLRPTEVAARYGGDEFMIILPEVGLQDALAAAERLRKAVSETPISVPGRT
ncbi:MAG TPA: GGDEF domain-containing protein, partial [Verrucomicrobiae bacterium]|nr:GGDEF domain-containing protein [Verrucomicrobiae bacterium]